jgi:NAD(P)-dependent dehydrogenase (short-subunit alcohol dehydrogenase family)
MPGAPKLIVITGVSRGLGRAMTEEFTRLTFVRHGINKNGLQRCKPLY